MTRHALPHQLKKLLRMQNKPLRFEATVMLVIARMLLKWMPFKKLAQQLGKRETEATVALSPKQQNTAQCIGVAVQRSATYMPFRALCFEQAIATQLMLRRRKLAHTLYLGVLSEHRNHNKEFKAHAWLRCGDNIVVGATPEPYAVISTFGWHHK